MGTKENRESSGKLELTYSFEETSSGHVETESSVELLGQGSSVILKISNSSKNYLKSRDSHSSNKTYTISVLELIKLIKEQDEENI